MLNLTVIRGASAVQPVHRTIKRAHYVLAPAGSAEPFLPEAPALGTVRLVVVKGRKKLTDHIKREDLYGLSEASIDASYAEKVLL